MPRILPFLFVASVGLGPSCVLAQQNPDSLVAEARLLTREEVRGLIDAASAGDAEAQLRLGLVYLHSSIVAQVPTEGARWLTLAAEQGVAHAQHLVGKMLLEGTLIPQDVLAGVKWIQASAEQGFAEAQYDYGLLHLDGVGVPQSNTQAFTWFKRAAEQESLGGITYLGICYVNGIGTPRNLPDGVRLIETAAMRGSPMAQANLGAMYAAGVGLHRDTTEALLWLFTAQLGGFEGLDPTITPLTSTMSDAEVGALRTQAEQRHASLAGEIQPSAPTAVDPALVHDSEAAAVALDSVTDWILSHLAGIGTFTVELMRDWDPQGVFEGSMPEYASARQQISQPQVTQCILGYRWHFYVDDADLQVQNQWYIPLWNIDVSTIRIQPIQLPMELRARGGVEAEVFMSVRPGEEFYLIDADQAQLTVEEHTIGVTSRTDAEELAEALEIAALACEANRGTEP